MSNRRLLHRASPLALGLAVATVFAVSAQAQSESSNVTVTGIRGTADAEAVTTAPLEATQPTSVLNQHFIENNVNLTSNYDDIVKFSPSVGAVAPNGPGLAENQYLTIRGFQDGQYNLTLDGIAWGDSNDFTHHSTSYLMAHDLGEVAVDRGPGTASTLGDATFGGTIALNTKDPLTHPALETYGSVASFSTYLGGLEVDTGAVSALGGARFLFDAEHLSSDGALTYMGQQRTNLFAKMVIPVNDKTEITAAVMYNQIHQNISLGSTDAEIAMFGRNYGLNNDPASQAYYGYNYDHITTDLAYVGVKSDLGNGWTLDEKVYSYAYYHAGYNGYDPNGETPNGTYYGANDVPGQILNNDYVSFGDMTRVSKDWGMVVARAGLWYDHQLNHRDLFDVDFTDERLTDIAQPNGGYPPVVGQISPNLVPGVEREQRNTLDTFQPYFEADIKPIDGLVITPGVKYDYFRRGIAAPVNQGTYQPLYYNKTWDAWLPSVAAHYAISPNLSVYGQVAKGFLAPNLNTLYTTNPAASSNLQPQTTWNYQAGAAFKSDRLTLSGDVYYIDFGNQIGKTNVANITYFYNLGGVIYSGVEGEADYRIWGPVNVYVNGSINDAKTKKSAANPIPFTVANSPKSTAAVGVSYDDRGLYGSILMKYTGPEYGDNGDPQNLHIPGYEDTQLSLGYTIKRTSMLPEIKISGMIDNLFDRRGHTALAGYTGDLGTPLWWESVPRNYELKLSATF